jgi:hypothetical protein
MSLISRKENFNPFYDIDDLPFTKNQKEMVLEYLARKFWSLLIEVKEWDNAGKCYDPLVINGKECYSYIFDLDNRGRTHKVNSLKELETQLIEEVIKELKTK